MTAPKRRIHLICNAHLDPVWLWDWEEGAAEALSTFRTAADLCDEFPEFVFCHNEALLYQWVEEYEPALFRRLQRLVRRGQWRIMGGWFLQPDCNMPAGESLVRQILTGRRYFKEKFGVVPTTAVNFDPFGHSRGLVQIMAKTGHDAYIFCRPPKGDLSLPGHEFEWIGFDGSSVMGSRSLDWYNTPLGKARERIEGRMRQFPDTSACYVPWGVGNHGGGPSRQDLRDIRALIGESRDPAVRHSYPEAYFAEVARRRRQLPKYAGDLNPWGPGCYTAQVRIKQAHRRLENDYYMTEKMAATAVQQGLMAEPAAEMALALRDLLFSEFHDILPGSGVPSVEDYGLRLMGRGIETVSQVKARAFFALSRGQRRAKDGEIPVMVFNPHPYPVRTTIACEFQLADQNLSDTFTDFTVRQGRRRVAAQIEREVSNIPLDWRKRMVFTAELKPMQMNRFDCLPVVRPVKPKPSLQAKGGRIVFDNGTLRVVINTRTGFIDSLRVDGGEYLGGPAFRPLVIRDSPDPWGVDVQSYREVLGAFRLATRAEGARLSGLSGKPSIPSVRVVEDGPVRSVVEALYRYGDSWLVQQFKLPRQGVELEVSIRVHWSEKDRFLKLSIPVRNAGRYLGQAPFGVGELPANGRECVAQKWVAVECRNCMAVTILNDGSYGSDFSGGELRLSLLRSPAYAAHPVAKRQLLPQDRYTPRIDQGERQFRFWISAGPAAARLAAVDREALVKNEVPMALSFFPCEPGRASAPKPLALLSDRVIQMPAIKAAEDGRGLIFRLFNPTGRKRSTVLRLPPWSLTQRITLQPYEVRSFRLVPRTRRWTEVDLAEQGG